MMVQSIVQHFKKIKIFGIICTFYLFVFRYAEPVLHLVYNIRPQLFVAILDLFYVDERNIFKIVYNLEIKKKSFHS